MIGEIYAGVLTTVPLYYYYFYYYYTTATVAAAAISFERNTRRGEKRNKKPLK